MVTVKSNDNFIGRLACRKEFLSPGLHLWSSNSKQSWSLEQRRSAGWAPTRAPPHRALPGGLPGFLEWKPALRSGKVPPKNNTDQAKAPITHRWISRLRPVWRWHCCHYLIADSSGNVAHLDSTCLSDVNAPPVEVSDADVHSWSQSQTRDILRLKWQMLCHATAGQLQPYVTNYI